MQGASCVERGATQGSQDYKINILKLQRTILTYP